jgi:hypothetical protein
MLPRPQEADMTQEERIAKLKTEVQRLAGNKAVMWGIDQVPPDVAEAFLKRVIAVEESERERDAEQIEPLSGGDVARPL